MLLKSIFHKLYPIHNLETIKYILRDVNVFLLKITGQIFFQNRKEGSYKPYISCQHMYKFVNSAEGFLNISIISMRRHKTNAEKKSTI